MFRWIRSCRLGFYVLLMWTGTGAVIAVTEPEAAESNGGEVINHPGLYIRHEIVPIRELPEKIGLAAKEDLAALGVESDNGYLDTRSLRWATLIQARPVIPGSGLNNTLEWADWGLSGPPEDPRILEKIAWNAVLGYVTVHEAEFDVELSQIETPALVVRHDDGDLMQIFFGRTLAGIEVEDSLVTATIKKGNLVLFGLRKWGDIDPSLPDRQALSAEDATAKVVDYLVGFAEVSNFWQEPHLSILPLDGASGQAPQYAYRLTWNIYPELEDETGPGPRRWRVQIDATNGEMLAFRDTVRHEREVDGGVFPLTNDGVAPGGVEQSYPMPFVDLTDGTASTFTNSAGFTSMFPAPGTVTTVLDGRYVGIRDACSLINQSGTGEAIDLGTSIGHDCNAPGPVVSGNTSAARTVYYELNRMMEAARGQLPNNTWLDQQLIANTNIRPECNATWDGTNVNFNQTDAGCTNSGELGPIVAHEFGHGLDDNPTMGSPAGSFGISSPGEGIADIYAALRFNDSCIGPGWGLGTLCDDCVSCDGVRDIDYNQHSPAIPHDPAWVRSNCRPPRPTVPPAAPPRVGPCGLGAHCEGRVTSEAIWDLLTVDLPARHGLDSNTALEVTTRLTYQAAAGVIDWWGCSMTPFNGCDPNSGYMQFLMADDDDGIPSNGTPHMNAIYDAFNRHGVACGPPAPLMMPTDSGCPNNPTQAPTVMVTTGHRTVELSWNAVPDATSYRIFRTEGVTGGASSCDLGKVMIDEVMSPVTSKVDSDLENGRQYSYIVLPVGAGPECMGPASACTTATPMTPPVPAAVTACGNCDRDAMGGVTVVDALLAAQVSAGLVQIPGPQQAQCDVDRSGAITIVDALIIAQASAGLPVVLDCPTCRDCDLDGSFDPVNDLTALRSRLGTDIVTAQDAVCDLNGDLRIDATDQAEMIAGNPSRCVTCGDNTLDGRVDSNDGMWLTPFSFAPGTLEHAAADVLFTPPSGVNVLDELQIANYVAGTELDLVCHDPGAASPRPRLVAPVPGSGVYCVSGVSNGTAFTGSVNGTSLTLLTAPAIHTTASLAALWQVEIDSTPLDSALVAGPGECFDITVPGGGAVTFLVGSNCDPDTIATGCPFG